MVILVAFAVLISACGGGGAGGLGDPPDPTETSLMLPTVPDGPVGTLDLPTVTGGGEQAGNAGDLCDSAPPVHSYLVEIGLLSEADLADLPVPYDFHLEGYFDVGPLGADGAFQVGAGLTEGLGLCDLEETPAVVAAIARLIEEFGSEVPVDEIIAIVTGEPVGTDPGTSDEGGTEDLNSGDLLQQTRDLLDAAGQAFLVGDDEAAQALIDEAGGLYTAYGETVINDSTDPADLLNVAGGAQLLGLEELADRAIAKVVDIVEKELSEAAKLFTPCTTDPDVVSEYFTALSRAAIMGHGPESAADAWYDIQERRALGEDVPDCEGRVFIQSVDLDGWDGTLDVHLETCGLTRWTGQVAASGTLAADGGTMTLEGNIPLDIYFKSQDAEVGSGDFYGLAQITLKTPDATGEGGTALSGRAFLTWVNGDLELELFFDAGTFDMAIHAAGMTIHQSRPIDWGEKVFTGPTEPFDALCANGD